MLKMQPCPAPRRLRRILCALVAIGALAVAARCGAPARAADLTSASKSKLPIGGPNSMPADESWRERLARVELLVAFQGKGSSLAFDAGVIQRAWDEQCLPALVEDRVVVSGNSSGSAYAVYFSCFGFSKQTIDNAKRRMLTADVKKVRENERGPKVANLIRGQETLIEPEALRDVIAFALGVDSSVGNIAAVVGASRAAPQRGVVIAAANAEVLANRAKSGSALRSQDYKEFDPANFNVSWKPDVFEFYRRRPEQFAKDHPHLSLGPDRFIGKALTYFVDRTMYELLSRIPPEERLGDLRLMETPADIAFAIQASSAEPTYFAPVAETDYDKLHSEDHLGTRGNTRKRMYAGGFIMPLVAHDVRRALPSIRVLGTGVARVPLEGRRLVTAWYLLDMQAATDMNAWWTDLEISMPRAMQEKMLIKRNMKQAEEFELGYARAKECFEADHGLPKYVVRPKFTWPAQEAILAAGRTVDFEAGDAEPRSLKTMRGLGPLLKPAAK